MAKNAKKKIRETFRNEVFERDGYKCVFCQRTDNLDAHHITSRDELISGGYFKENGITLCPVHHEQAEECYKTKGVKFLCMSPAHLYKMIGSSYSKVLGLNYKWVENMRDEK